jgi:hypothetical protein
MTDGAALPSPERLAYLIVGDLADDDMGLWEIVWGLNAAHPGADLSDKIRLARTAVSLLADETELWLGDPLGPSGAPLTEKDVRALGDDDAAWHDPANASVVVWLRARA